MSYLDYLIIVLFLLISFLLLLEKITIIKSRNKIKLLIHVNGTRGKSTIVRMLDAAFRANGYRTYSKITGTVPRYRDTNGKIINIKRLGKANIREQRNMLISAAKEAAEVLILECMAVDPNLQECSEQQILSSDITVITNVKSDHRYEMGFNQLSRCQSLCRSIAKNALVFTADFDAYECIKLKAERKSSKAIYAKPYDDKQLCEFESVNIGLALGILKSQGMDLETSLKAILNMEPDPFSFSVFRTKDGFIFANALSANDSYSTLELFYEAKKFCTDIENVVILINNREDRPDRLLQMLKLSELMEAKEIWVLGAKRYINVGEFNLSRSIKFYEKCECLPFAQLNSTTLLFAMGNIANEGLNLLTYVGIEVTQVNV